MPVNKDTWLIADTHLNHKNILHFRNYRTGELIRPGFDDIHQMNEYIIEQWNSHIKPGDKVIHLGDVFFGPKDEFLPMWKRLHGSKELIVGNHDDIKFFAKNELVTKIHMWKQMREFGLLLSHVPLHKNQLRKVSLSQDYDYPKNYMVNIHGHIHDQPSPEGPYRCICVEQTEYKPVHIEDLKQKLDSITS
jgi:calcineurin-like phosphoesterase family protein